ncbi:hypothetical protein ACWD5Q_15845 [Streptomyces sp. NPDC002513]
MRFRATPEIAGPARDAPWSELPAAGVDCADTHDRAGPESFLDSHERA